MSEVEDPKDTPPKNQYIDWEIEFGWLIHCFNVFDIKFQLSISLNIEIAIGISRNI